MRTSPGRPFPLGATVTAEGINFAVFSRHATAVFLELFKRPNDRKPAYSIALDAKDHRSGDIWHVFVHRARHGQLYGYRVDGPYEPEQGHRFNVNKLLSDPYARSYTGRYLRDDDAIYGYDRTSAAKDLSFSHYDSAAHTVKSVALAADRFDWQDDRPPQVPTHETVLYEAHVRGFTQHPSSRVAHPGTYLGLAEKIPHLRQLGVTTVELLPVHHFDIDEPLFVSPDTGQRLTNYWGYSTLGFFAPQAHYASDSGPGAEVDEFKEMVRRLHQAGIEVILDVVYNHTGEGSETGPTFSFRGLDNAVYYMLDEGREYFNFSGCGNTVACHHPVVKQLIIDSLRYWVLEMHVDGFRFDLATVLGRGPDGEWLGSASLVGDIIEDPLLRGVKLIAEPWDAAGMYQVGRFPDGWLEWNDRFRDDMRRFVRGDQGQIAALARRLGGSADLFEDERSAWASINFVTCHDGFTLRDLVSYSEKHNEANGEKNRDGTHENWSANYGVEGETDDSDIRDLRLRQAKNLLTLLLTSRGTPMILAGDELWRTQQGNNNAYCHDNELGWIDWQSSPEQRELLRFVRLLLRFRKHHPALSRPDTVDPFPDEDDPEAANEPSDIIWHGVNVRHVDWGHYAHGLAVQIVGCPPDRPVVAQDCDLYLVFNGWTEPLTFQLPQLRAPLAWHRVIDTAEDPPEDILEEGIADPVDADTLSTSPQSAVILVARKIG